MKRLMINPTTSFCPICYKRRTILKIDSVEKICCLDHPEHNDILSLNLELSKFEALISFMCKKDKVIGFECKNAETGKFIEFYELESLQTDRTEIGLIFAQLANNKIKQMGLPSQLKFNTDSKGIIRYIPEENADLFIILSAYLHIYKELKDMKLIKFGFEKNNNTIEQRSLFLKYKEHQLSQDKNIRVRRLRV